MKRMQRGQMIMQKDIFTSQQCMNSLYSKMIVGITNTVFGNARVHKEGWVRLQHVLGTLHIFTCMIYFTFHVKFIPAVYKNTHHLHHVVIEKICIQWRLFVLPLALQNTSYS